ncbi:unnamed protein product [Hymenolepis diminuta]|uniref:Cullin neddylation domain-containing protein n=1 Tax=Hymenolepis diminuta TaxID=6216 RepID=A0A564YQR6_HYMDI|nr:unnamed protein product [Hymenolepis diminuta]
MSRILNVSAKDETTEQQHQQAEECPFEIKGQKDLPKISLNNKLTLNLNYSSDRIFVNLNLPLKKEISLEEAKKFESKVECDRTLAIQCCIARIMKAQKRTTNQDLVKKVQEQLSTTFHPPLFLIKSGIDSLIRKSIIQRDPNDMSIYEYIP